MPKVGPHDSAAVKIIGVMVGFRAGWLPDIMSWANLGGGVRSRGCRCSWSGAFTRAKRRRKREGRDLLFFRLAKFFAGQSPREDSVDYLHGVNLPSYFCGEGGSYGG